jgi:hypothetical protein
LIYLLEYIEQVLDLVENFFSSSFENIKDLRTSLNPKEAVKGIEKLESLGEQLVGWFLS